MKYTNEKQMNISMNHNEVNGSMSLRSISIVGSLSLLSFYTAYMYTPYEVDRWTEKREPNDFTIMCRKT